MPLNLAVCIPCAPKDRVYLPYCLASVAAQTRRPDSVVVALSTIANPNNLLLDLSGIDLKVEFVYTSNTLFAGGNRNLAAARAVELGATLLSFFDADDLMHPQRIERIEATFTAHPNMTGLVHHFVVGPKSRIDVYRGESPIPWEPIVEDCLPDKAYVRGTYGKIDIIKFQQCFKRPFRRGYGMGACGHISVLADFWNEFPYVDTIGKGEDNHFAASLLIHEKQLGYTGDTLSCYMRADFKHFQTGL